MDGHKKQKLDLEDMFVIDPAIEERITLLADAIASETGVSRVAILGRRRFPHIAAARHKLFEQLFLDGLSTSAIGRALRVDHTTVMHGLKKTMGDEKYRETMNRRRNGSVW
jgi:chromosomal replication initiation ATPase DnaA